MFSGNYVTFLLIAYHANGYIMQGCAVLYSAVLHSAVLYRAVVCVVSDDGVCLS